MDTATDTETRIREALAKSSLEWGSKSRIAEAFGVSSSTVTRWVDGGEIPKPMLLLLDCYFFGAMPPMADSSGDITPDILPDICRGLANGSTHEEIAEFFHVRREDIAPAVSEWLERIGKDAQVDSTKPAP